MRKWRTAAAIIGFLSLFGFLVFQTGVATKYAADKKYQQANHAANQSAQSEPILYAWWRWTTHDPVAFYTSVLTLFTSILAISTIGLWWSTRNLWKAGERQLGHLEDTAERQLRAYVAIKEIKMVPFRNPDTMGAYGAVPGNIHHFQFYAIVENTGQTPTRNAVISINKEIRAADLPTDFSYPDGQIEHAHIAANGIFLSPAFFVAVAEIEKVIAKKQRMFVWGWIDYNDAFDNSPRLRTEFCVDIVPDEFWDKTEIKIRFPTFGRFNGGDEDCMRQPTPYTPPT